ncbi:hypothetical protein HMPREF9554_01686 [Treponema phagedenis F0421]|nr:hypothetical protein HMPREF9554_01686 [Treponema phagedenis F0421]
MLYAEVLLPAVSKKKVAKFGNCILPMVSLLAVAPCRFLSL